MSYSSEQILDILKTVVHPEKKKDVVALEMVENLEIKDNKVSFYLVFSKANATNIANLKKNCVEAIENALGEEVAIRGNIQTRMLKEEEPASPMAKVKNIIAIASGKGGVGKSTVSSNLAVALANSGAKVGLIDADIFGPSIPKMFGLEGVRPEVTKVDDKEIIIPAEKYGVKMLSLGFFTDPEDAMIWRGPMASNALTQLIMQGQWGELDYLLIDLPPGTSDIHLTIVQTVSVTGAVVVSTPQDVALADAIKGINMFKSEKINVPVLGLIENMAYFTPAELPDNKYYIFGKDGCKKLAEKLNMDFLGQIPIVQSIREGGDSGVPVAANQDSITGMAFADLASKVIANVEQRNEQGVATQVVETQSDAPACH